MESDADAGRYHRYKEPDPEMEDGGDGTPHKRLYATLQRRNLRRARINMQGPVRASLCTLSVTV